jgi:hypothetical protein
MAFELPVLRSVPVKFLSRQIACGPEVEIQVLNVDIVHGVAARTGGGRHQSERVDQRRGEGSINARASLWKNRPYRKL